MPYGATVEMPQDFMRWARVPGAGDPGAKSSATLVRCSARAGDRTSYALKGHGTKQCAMMRALAIGGRIASRGFPAPSRLTLEALENAGEDGDGVAAISQRRLPDGPPCISSSWAADQGHD